MNVTRQLFVKKLNLVKERSFVFETQTSQLLPVHQTQIHILRRNQT